MPPKIKICIKTPFFGTFWRAIPELPVKQEKTQKFCCADGCYTPSETTQTPLAITDFVWLHEENDPQFSIFDQK